MGDVGDQDRRAVRVNADRPVQPWLLTSHERQEALQSGFVSANDDAQYSTANATRRYVGGILSLGRANTSGPGRATRTRYLSQDRSSAQIHGAQTRRSLRFLSPIHRTAAIHGQGRGAGRDRVAGHELVSGPGHPSRGGGGFGGGHATVRHRLLGFAVAERHVGLARLA